jgi:very-short-patch-repair endonuclease
MYAGDRARKQNLVEYGFRLPSALDNRPLRNEEFFERIGQAVYVSATPGETEMEVSEQVVEQIIRPTGLIDPEIVMKPVLPKKGLTPNPSPSERGTGQGKLKTANKKDFDSLNRFAKSMRSTPTESENLLWQELRAGKLGTKFRRQHVIGSFIADFYNVENNLIVEVDGSIHDLQKDKDQERDEVLKDLGFNMLRVSSDQVLTDIKEVLSVISKKISDIQRALKALPAGEGLGGADYPGQVEDFINETVKEVKSGGRVLVTTLTKKMAEDLSVFLRERKIKAEYIHSDVKTMDRIQILTKFRKGDFDCLVGVNLLREGLDLPEVSLIGILDADKEGFLRSETSLIQTIGRAARNVLGRVILYADIETGSIQRAVGETNRRREIQKAYNEKHDITPKTILKSIHDITQGIESIQKKTAQAEAFRDLKLTGQKLDRLLKQKQKEMKEAARDLDFETAAILRDEIKELERMQGDKSDAVKEKKAKKLTQGPVPNKIEKKEQKDTQKKGKWDNKK